MNTTEESAILSKSVEIVAEETAELLKALLIKAYKRIKILLLQFKFQGTQGII